MKEVLFYVPCSWRVVPDFNPEEGPEPDEPIPSEDEFDIQTDLNEESIKIRHDRCEVDEHKRFNSIPDKSASRRARRLDSRTESLDFSFSSKRNPIFLTKFSHSDYLLF